MARTTDRRAARRMNLHNPMRRDDP
jgi:hypothetical protein